MNTNTLKKFAQQARVKLLEQVGARLEYVLQMDSAELREKAKHIENLQKAIFNSSKEQVIDKVAYTWFNRLMALRFMDANDYQPLDIRIVTPKTGDTLPEILYEAKQGNIPGELPVNGQRIADIIDGKIPNASQNEAYKELLIGACNHLHDVFPFLFERINDYAELLLPEDLTSEFSIIQDFQEGMPVEDCQEVEIIGWLYQFYISERKDEVFASKSKVAKEDIPAATQLFTPRWIVEYMVQNTLGKLWLQNRPQSNLKQYMPYFIESPSLDSKDFLKVDSVEEIRLLDQACGSGHILVYAFDLFSKIYEEEGYQPSQIPQLIIEKNLSGFEIDERAAQLAGMALMMKARSYNRRLFRKEIKPNILQFKDLTIPFEEIKTILLELDLPIINYQHRFRVDNKITIEILEDCGIEIDWKKWKKQVREQKKLGIELIPKVYLKVGDVLQLSKEHLTQFVDECKAQGLSFIEEVPQQILSYKQEDLLTLARKHKQGDRPSPLLQDLKAMRQITNIGSLLIPKSEPEDLDAAWSKIHAYSQKGGLFAGTYTQDLLQAAEQLQQLAQKQHCVVDNPPYMGSGNMNADLSFYVKENYPDSKADLMACFMEAGLKTLHSKGYLGMINQHSWMFLSSYEKLREKLIHSTSFDTLLHLGPRTFPEIGGEVVQNAAFTFWNTAAMTAAGSYIRLVDFKDSELKRTKTLEAIQNPNCGWYHTANQKYFEKIPGSQIVFWISDNLKKVFLNHIPLKEVAEPRKGITTGNDSNFVRLWFESENCKIEFEASTDEDFVSTKKWFPVVRGGEFRKWHGNLFAILDWEDDGNKIKNFKDSRGKLRSRPQNTNYNFYDGISWNDVSSGTFAARITGEGKLMQAVGPKIFNSFNQKLLLGLLNSKVGYEFFKCIAPGIKFEVGTVGIFPIYNPIIEYQKEFDFIQIIDDCIKNSLNEWNSRETSWDFLQNELLRHQGQDLEESYDLYCAYWRKQFFHLHQNEEELNRQFIDIYGLQEELTPDVPLEDITILKQEADIIEGDLVFDANEIIRQLVSYAVGCMFGRYSLDKEGLILANQGESLEDYLQKIEKTDREVRFLPDDDNIIPILDDEWFEDDIVGRFYVFLKAAFGTASFEKNLAFVEDSLGMSVRKYFIKEFYKDHIKRYKKRPIYWLFSSPKGAFNVLVYMHRYTRDTLNQILNGYLVEYREKLKTQVEQLDHLIETGSASEQNKAAKDKEKIKVILIELTDYEREILRPLATNRPEIDLDDGVLVNYNKFGSTIKTVTGLNDKKAKAKVRKFDWIAVEQIRD